MIKDFEHGICTFRAEHKLKRSLDVIVHGVVMNGKCYSDVLIRPEPDNPASDFEDGEQFEADCKEAAIMETPRGWVQRIKGELEICIRRTPKTSIS